MTFAIPWPLASSECCFIQGAKGSAFSRHSTRNPDVGMTEATGAVRVEIQDCSGFCQTWAILVADSIDGTSDCDHLLKGSVGRRACGEVKIMLLAASA